jgi:hypothetical protein
MANTTALPAGAGEERRFRRLLARTSVALIVGAVLVLLCYLFLDRPVAYFVHSHRTADEPVLKWLTYPPPVLQSWAPAALVALAVRRAWGPLRRCERTLLAAGVGMILADQFRESLSFVFGRYWPDTWVNNNPSLIHDGAYGFHPFHGGAAYGSFPSGPRWWWTGTAVVLATAVGLVGMNYHFVGDVVAGAFVGGIVGAYTATGCGLGKAASEPGAPATGTRSPVADAPGSDGNE